MNHLHRGIFRRAALAVMAVDFPLLYVAAVGIESAVLTAAALALMALAAVTVAIVY